LKPISKAIRLAALAAAGSLALAACGSSSDGTATAPATTPATSTSATTSAPATATPTDDKCSASDTTSLRIGELLPVTGSLAFLNPPEVAGVGLAVSDLNAAGGVNGQKVCYDLQDSSDSDHLSVSTKSAKTLVANKDQVVIGAASSTVSLNVVDYFAAHKTVEISPANTSSTLSGYSPWYFRTAPPDSVQGSALGSLINSDGYSRVAFLVFQDDYGTGLRDYVQSTIEANGGKCTYGCKGDNDEFAPSETSFSSQVAAAKASNPDAYVVIAFDQTTSILPEMKSQGIDMSKIYMTDGNTADYSSDFAKGLLTGAQGTIPGADASPAFKSLVSAWWKLDSGKKLTSYSYAAESYDATMLAALAAAKGGSNDSTTIKDNIAAVSGASGGTKCTTYAECVSAAKTGDIEYTGPSGIGPINKDDDPSSAYVGIYKYNSDNTPVLTTTVQGSVG
jgi:neutral amino acid transport system substrate-binding protein